MRYMNVSTSTLDITKIIAQFLLDILYFPLWWYSRGLFKLLLHVGRFISSREKGLALGVWVKNIFTPMYGQHDWAGILISFITRVLQIIVRSLIMLFWLTLCLIALLLWLAAPLFIAYELIFQLITPI